MSLGLLDEFGIGDAREREESWRYSKGVLRALSQQQFLPAATALPLSAQLQAQFDWMATRGRRLVFINGAFAAAYSDVGALDSTTLIEQGAGGQLVVSLSGTSDEPLHLVYANAPGSGPTRWGAATRIELRAGRATIIEQHVGEIGRASCRERV